MNDSMLDKTIETGSIQILFQLVGAVWLLVTNNQIQLQAAPSCFVRAGRLLNAVHISLSQQFLSHRFYSVLKFLDFWDLEGSISGFLRFWYSERFSFEKSLIHN